jgi:hypothetical protein
VCVTKGKSSKENAGFSFARPENVPGFISLQPQKQNIHTADATDLID